MGISPFNWTTSQFNRWFNAVDGGPGKGDGIITYDELIKRREARKGQNTSTVDYLIKHWEELAGSKTKSLNRTDLLNNTRTDLGDPVFSLTRDTKRTISTDKFDSWFDSLKNQWSEDNFINKDDLKDRIEEGKLRGFQTPNARFLLNNYDRIAGKDGKISYEEAKNAKFDKDDLKKNKSKNAPKAGDNVNQVTKNSKGKANNQKTENKK
jgi:hypothetical protein